MAECLSVNCLKFNYFALLRLIYMCTNGIKVDSKPGNGHINFSLNDVTVSTFVTSLSCMKYCVGQGSGCHIIVLLFKNNECTCILMQTS